MFDFKGTMDASAFISPEEWNALLEKLELDEERMCEGRYDHVVHMVSSLTAYFVQRFLNYESNMKILP